MRIAGSFGHVKVVFCGCGPVGLYAPAGGGWVDVGRDGQVAKDIFLRTEDKGQGTVGSPDNWRAGDR